MNAFGALFHPRFSTDTGGTWSHALRESWISSGPDVPHGSQCM